MARDLHAVTSGRTIEEAALSYRPIVATDPDLFAGDLVGRTVASVDRVGKWVRFNLSDGWVMLVHLKMTGQFVIAPWPEAGDLWPPHCHAGLRLSDTDQAVFYADTRKFGRLRVFPPERADRFLRELALGPDALTVGPEEFHQRVTAKKAHLKAALLDQSLVSGLGNIYVDETLFAAGLSPRAQAEDLTPEQTGRILSNAVAILRQAIEMRGSTVRSYRSLGEDGGYQSRHQVYGKAGNPCPRCGTILLRDNVASRGTVYCPRCQS